MGQILSIVSQKGGVGKTTTAINIAAAFARRGMRTLLVDVDPQGAVRHGLGLGHGSTPWGFADYLSGERSLREVILPTALQWLGVLTVGTIAERGDHEAYQNLVADTSVLGNLLGMVRDRCNVVVVDTPPGLGSIVRRTLDASQHAIIPLQCEPLALQTASQMLRGLQLAVARNGELTLDGILLTMYERGNGLSERVADYVRQQLPPEMVFDMVIPRSPAAVDAFAAGQPVVLRAADDPAAQAYTALADVMAERLGD